MTRILMNNNYEIYLFLLRKNVANDLMKMLPGAGMSENINIDAFSTKF